MLSGSPIETTYAHDRRKHRHRCRCCNKIVHAGERVVMAKVADRTTWVIHEACGERRQSDDHTWREAMALWAGAHKQRLA